MAYSLKADERTRAVFVAEKNNFVFSGCGVSSSGSVTDYSAQSPGFKTPLGSWAFFTSSSLHSFISGVNLSGPSQRCISSNDVKAF